MLGSGFAIEIFIICLFPIRRGQDHLRSIRRNTLAGNVTRDVADMDSVDIEGIDGKRAAVFVSTMFDSHLFPDVGAADRMSAEVETQRKMIESERGRPDLLPYPQAETLSRRRARGIHYFRSITVPLGVPGVENGAIRYTWVILGYKRKFPKAHHGGAGGFVIGNQYELRRLPGGRGRLPLSLSASRAGAGGEGRHDYGRSKGRGYRSKQGFHGILLFQQNSDRAERLWPDIHALDMRKS